MIKACHVKFFLFLLLTLFTSGYSQTRVLFRIDDFGIDNEEFYPKLFEIFKKHDSKLLVGVVPFKEINGRIDSLTNRQIEILKAGIEMGVVEVAQHGYSHQNNSYGKNDSEFRGLPWNEQYWRLKTGKEYLQKTFGVDVKTFVPPWNQYDDITISVLERLGFNVISGSLSSLPIGNEKCKLVMLPSTSNLPGEFPSNKNPLLNGSFQVILFHGYDFEENRQFYIESYPYSVNGKHDFSINKMDSLLSRLKNSSVLISSVAEMVDQGICLTPFQFNNVRHRSFVLPLPSIFSKKPIKIIYDRSFSYFTFFQAYALPSLFYLAVFFTSMILYSKVIGLNKKKTVLIFISAMTALSLFTGIVYLITYALGWKPLLLTVFSFGGFVKLIQIKQANENK